VGGRRVPKVSRGEFYGLAMPDRRSPDVDTQPDSREYRVTVRVSTPVDWTRFVGFDVESVEEVTPAGWTRRVPGKGKRGAR